MKYDSAADVLMPTDVCALMATYPACVPAAPPTPCAYCAQHQSLPAACPSSVRYGWKATDLRWCLFPRAELRAAGYELEALYSWLGLHMAVQQASVQVAHRPLLVLDGCHPSMHDTQMQSAACEWNGLHGASASWHPVRVNCAPGCAFSSACCLGFSFGFRTLLQYHNKCRLGFLICTVP